jgi:hypothetical protein
MSKLEKTYQAREKTFSSVDKRVLSSLEGFANNEQMFFSENLLLELNKFFSGKEISHNFLEFFDLYLEYLQQFRKDLSHLINFNVHEVPGVKGISGIEKYMLRALSLVKNSEDLIVVPENIDENLLLEMKKIREDLGLPVGKLIRESLFKQNRLELAQDFHYSEFYRTEESLDKNNYFLQEWFEDKLNSMFFLYKKGIKVVPQVYGGTKENFEIESIKIYPVVCKKVRSAGGAGVFICENKEEVEKFVADLNNNELFQIQAFIQGIDSSKQFFLGEKGALPLSNTDQIIEAKVEHAGNKVTSKILNQADNFNLNQAAYEIWKTGYRGDMSFDVIKPHNGNDAMILEVNLRKGGVTTPLNLATKLGKTNFTARNVLAPDLLSFKKALKKFGLTEKKEEGVTPYAMIPLGQGQIKAQILSCLPELQLKEFLNLVNPLKYLD